MKAEHCSALFFCGFFVIERKIDGFYGMSWAPSPTNVDVGEGPIRHINVKLHVYDKSHMRIILP